MPASGTDRAELSAALIQSPQRCRVRPGDHIRFEEAGEVIRVVPANTRLRTKALDVSTRLELFDAATERQRAREANQPARCASALGWTREALYTRGRQNAD